MTFATKRLSKELMKLQTGQLPPGITLVSADNFEEWLMDIRVMDDNPLYKDETYTLKFMFSKSYPIGTFSRPRASSVFACSSAPNYLRRC